MNASLYDLSVGTYQQIVDATVAILDKSATHFAEHNMALDEVVAKRLYPDMLNFQNQIVGVAHQSIGVINGMIAGEFAPPKGIKDTDYAGLQAMMSSTSTQLAALSPDTINALTDGQTVFNLGENKLPFTNENFILSFSLPNFYFHATTTYDILRHLGVPLGKRDFLGKMRIGV